MTATGRIRPVRPDDAEALLALNEANVPEVGSIDADKLEQFLELAPVFSVVEIGGRVAGMLIGLSERSTFYASPNYRWFAERYPTFAYVDRIALAPEARGGGWGPELYRRFEDVARATGRPVLCAEVNTIPDNPRSHRFHQRFGFAEVGRTQPYGPDEEVAMYSYEVAERR